VFVACFLLFYKILVTTVKSITMDKVNVRCQTRRPTSSFGLWIHQRCKELAEQFHNSTIVNVNKDKNVCLTYFLVFQILR
jgi:hypothetical protein